VFDPLSARIAEGLGYEVGMFTGSVASLAVVEPRVIFGPMGLPVYRTTISSRI
jgi:hypothetical protein